MSQIHYYDISTLILEDDNTTKNSIKRLLELIVKEVYVASNGVEALEIISQEKI